MSIRVSLIKTNVNPCYVGMYLISYYFKHVYHNYLELHNINLKFVFTNLSIPFALQVSYMYVHMVKKFHSY